MIRPPEPDLRMLFHQYSFLFVFLPLFLATYYLSPASLRNTVVLLANCTFYGASSLLFLPLLLFTVSVDYLVGARIAAASTERGKRRWLLLSLASNLGVLGYFKYIGLITRTLGRIPGLEAVPEIDAPLPPGISFYVFQSLSYTIDLARRRVEPTRSLIDLAAFVTLFPHLIAGPIVRFSYIKDQLRGRVHSVERAASGIYLFVIGLGKKLLIADTLAALCDPLFEAGTPAGFLGAWGSILLYAGQIYFDFSGYSDMAVGLGRLFGFELPVNFNSPYKAESFADFWRRWHITLSSWLRDYLYIPLGGNRHGKGRTYLNLWLTMFLGGLWHGASWSFAVWGTLHGTYLAVERMLGDKNPVARLPPFGRRLVTFLGVLVAWVFFRIEDFGKALSWLGAMFLGTSGLGELEGVAALAIVAMLALIWIPKNSMERRPTFAPVEIAMVVAGFVLSLVVGNGRGISPFLYFRF